jgi:antitoxin component HigA of HigAB toxin-antitoxin module
MSALALELPHFIESEAEYEQALGITGDLISKQNRTQEDTRRLKTWSVLIRDYEQRRYADVFAKSEPREILRFLLEENGIGQSDIPGIPQPRISDILAGRRDVTVHQAHILGHFFRTDFSLFLK